MQPNTHPLTQMPQNININLGDKTYTDESHSRRRKSHPFQQQQHQHIKHKIGKDPKSMETFLVAGGISHSGGSGGGGDKSHM